MGERNSYRDYLVAGGVGVAAVGVIAAVVLATGGFAQAAGKPGLSAHPVTPDVTTTSTAPPAHGYQFVTLGSHKDRRSNDFYGINNHGRIAGSYGSGNKGNPAKGYTMFAPYGQGNIASENFPGSVQTAVEGLNDNNVQVGYYSTQNKINSNDDNSFGWYYNGKFHKVVYPTGGNHSPVVDQLNGVNNHDIAVGSYENAAGRYRGYTFNIKTGKFALITKPGAPGGGAAPSLQAFGINNAGDTVGDYTSSHAIDGFFRLAAGGFHTIAVSGAFATVALGVNDNDTVVGAYEIASGGTVAVHGFIWHIGGTLITNVDDPLATGFSYIDGINNEGDIVGSDISSTGHHGYLAYPAF